MKRSIGRTRTIGKSTSVTTGTSVTRGRSFSQSYSRRGGSTTTLGQLMSSGEPALLTPKARENHTHVLGSTGTGKSKFLELMLRQDIKDENCGVCLLDPHGKLYNDILAYVATSQSSLAERIVLFNPFNDLDNIIGFNPIPKDLSRIDYIEKTVTSACLKAWGQSNPLETPRISRWLGNIFHTLLVNDLTLVESIPLLSTERQNDYRDRMLGNIQSETVMSDWASYLEATLTQRQQIIEGAGNRLLQFLQNEIIRLILGQKENAIDLGQIMDEGKILLINLNDESGRVTPSDANLLGTMIISELFRITKQRDVYDPDLKPFYVYIDEFAQYVTKDIALALEEARKFKTFFILAHQHLSQLKREDAYLYASVLTNCKNKVVFGGLSEEDADTINKEISTGFVDLKSVKHEQIRIREQHVETTREVRSQSISHSNSNSQTHGESIGMSSSDMTGVSKSETQTQAHSKSHTEGSGISQAHALGKTHGATQSHSDGTTQTSGISANQSQSIGVSEGKGSSFGGSRSHTDGRSESLSQSETNSRGQSSSDTQTQSHTDTTGSAVTKGESFSRGTVDTTSNSHSISDNSSDGRSVNRDAENFEKRSISDSSNRSHGETVGRQSSHSESQNETVSTSRTNSSFHSDTHGNSHTKGTSKSFAQTQGQTIGENSSDTHGENWSDSQNTTHSLGLTLGKGESQSQAQSHMEVRGKSQSETATDTNTQSRNVSDATTDSESHSFGRQSSSSHTDTRSQSSNQSETTGISHTEGESVSVVPFLEPKEIAEVSSVEFWSREDLLYMEKAKMKNLDVAQAFIKIASDAPFHCKVANVPDVAVSRHLRDDLVKELQDDIISYNFGNYVPLSEAHELISKRQIDQLGGTIQFLNTLASPEEENVVLIEGGDGIFER